MCLIPMCKKMQRGLIYISQTNFSPQLPLPDPTWVNGLLAIRIHDKSRIYLVPIYLSIQYIYHVDIQAYRSSQHRGNTSNDTVH